MTKVNMTAILARFLVGAPTRVIASERNHVSMQMRHWAALNRLIFRTGVRLLYPHADHLTAVTEEVATDIAKLSGVRRERITVVYNPTPDPDDIAQARANPLPHPWFASGDPIVVAIGRLVPQKGFHNLLDAFALVRQQLPARLIILGDGPLLSELRSETERPALNGAVVFLGFVGNRFDYLVNASLYVLSSDFEGFPNSLLEALACDVPVVSTDCAGGGARVILGQDDADAIVAVGNTVDLADAIVRALVRQKRSGEFVARARRFSMENTADTFLGLVAASAK
jgi:glycosyltransferase involved in cell wall biosynthesis